MNIQQKRGTSTAWTAENPKLLAGELGLETDTGRFKFGDGTHGWNELDYAVDLEEWTFVLDDDSEVTKEVAAWTSAT